MRYEDHRKKMDELQRQYDRHEAELKVLKVALAIATVIMLWCIW